MSTARASIAGLAMLMTIALISFLAWGCGESASPPQSPYPASTQAAATAPVAGKSVTQADRSSSVHARVMAEHRLRMAAAAQQVTTTTTTAAGAPQSSAPPSNVPSAQASSTTAVVLTDGQTPLRGVWSGTAQRLASFLVGQSASPRFTVPVPTLAEYYVRYCGEAGLRADLLWAQMMHETGRGMYGGDVLPEQNNFAGIGATGGHEPGFSFPTAEAGVIAHVAHMVAYVYALSPVSWADASTDPRFDFVNPRGAAAVLADLNGRWAVPGTTYGQSIESIVRAINTE